MLYGDPRPGSAPLAVEQGHEILRGLLKRIAEAGRLKVEVERARQIVHSACKGVVLTLIATPMEARDPGLSDAAREGILSVITAPVGPRSMGARDKVPVATCAIALRSALDQSSTLTPAEAGLLAEWLDRLAREP